MNRLMLAYAWGKWLALRRAEYEQAMEYYKSQRARKNWAILVEQDEMACLYQRCQFRVQRAMRAVGATGMTGFATFDDKEPNSTITMMGIEFPVKAASTSQVEEMNRDSFARHERARAVSSKLIMDDKRHPLAHYADVCAQRDAEAYQAELYASAYS